MMTDKTKSIQNLSQHFEDKKRKYTAQDIKQGQDVYDFIHLYLIKKFFPKEASRK